MLFNNGLLNATTDGEGEGFVAEAVQAGDDVVLLRGGMDAGAQGRGVVGRSVIVHATSTGGARDA